MAAQRPEVCEALSAGVGSGNTINGSAAPRSLQQSTEPDVLAIRQAQATAVQRPEDCDDLVVTIKPEPTAAQRPEDCDCVAIDL